MSFHLQPTQLTLKPEYLLNSSNLLNVPLGRSHSNVWWNFEKHVLNDMVDGIGHPPTTTRNNTKTKTKKRCNNLHYTHLHCLHFYMYLGMTIVEQPTLLFCRHNKFCYDMKQTTLQSWSNLPTQSLMMESPLFSGSRTHLKFRRRMWYQQMAKGVHTQYRYLNLYLKTQSVPPYPAPHHQGRVFSFPIPIFLMDFEAPQFCRSTAMWYSTAEPLW